MKFIEMTGKTFSSLLREEELQANDLTAAGIQDDTIVRVNEHGDIEVRRKDRWDVVGGLLGSYLHRIHDVTGMDWA